jgi:hypothetical protein
MYEQVFPLSSHLLGQIGPREPKSRVSEKPIRRKPVQNPKPRHFKPFEFFDHTGYVGNQSETEKVSVRATIASDSHGRRGIMRNQTVGVSYSLA